MIIAPHPDGVHVQTEIDTADFLARLPDILESLHPQEEASRRLAPPVYLGDEEANAEWWGFMAGELDRGRHEDRDAFRAAMSAAAKDGGVVLEPFDAQAVARVVTELRLVLAARLGIETEDDYAGLAVEDHALLDVLAGVQMGILTALDHHAGPA